MDQNNLKMMCPNNPPHKIGRIHNETVNTERIHKIGQSGHHERHANYQGGNPHVQYKHIE